MGDLPSVASVGRRPRLLWAECLRGGPWNLGSQRGFAGLVYRSCWLDAGVDSSIQHIGMVGYAHDLMAVGRVPVLIALGISWRHYIILMLDSMRPP